MDDEVIVPAFDIEADKPAEVVVQEAEQKNIQQQVADESKHTAFPKIREHWEKIMNDYGDVTVLAGLPAKDSADFEVAVRTKAAIYTELKAFLEFIDTVEQQDEPR